MIAQTTSREAAKRAKRISIRVFAPSREPRLGFFGYLGAILCAVWLLACVCVGLTDLRRELRALGLD